MMQRWRVVYVGFVDVIRFLHMYGIISLHRSLYVDTTATATTEEGCSIGQGGRGICNQTKVCIDNICKPCEELCNGKSPYCMHKGLEKNITCVNCTGFSEGPKCERCQEGYYHWLGRKQNKCIKCNCNGHGTCKDGICTCLHNTETPEGGSRVFREQCSKCKSTFSGTPKNGSQCYKILSRDDGVKIITKRKSMFLYVTPNFVDANLQIVLDVYQGQIDVYVVSAVEYEENHFKMDKGGQVIVTSPPNIELSFSSYSMFLPHRFNDSILLVRGVKHRLVIDIPPKLHDFSRSKFYIALGSDRPEIGGEGLLYFTQDQPKLNFILFFLTLLVTLMLIFSSFMFAWKVCTRRVEYRQLELQRLQMKPHAAYKMYCDYNEDVDTMKRNNSTRSSRNLLGGNRQTNKPSVKRVLTPVLIECTGDCSVSVVTVVVQFPENELSTWNFTFATGLFETNSHQQEAIKV